MFRALAWLCREGDEGGAGADDGGEGVASAPVAVEDLVALEPADGVFDVDALAGEGGVELPFRFTDRLGPVVGLASPLGGECLRQAEAGSDADVGLVSQDGDTAGGEWPSGGGGGDPGEVMGHALVTHNSSLSHPGSRAARIRW